MDRERITISIKKNVLGFIDKTIDKINIRNRSHAIEYLVLKGLQRSDDKNAVILLGGKDAMKHISATEDILKTLKSMGYEKVYLAVGFLADKIEAKLGDGEKYNLDLEYLRDGEGSAGALLPLKKIFKSTFLVINLKEDNLFDLEDLVDFHKKQNAVATLALVDQKTKEGIYAFEPDVFRHISKGFSMLEEEVFPKLSKRGELVGFLQF